MSSTSFVASSRGRAQRANLINNLGVAGRQATAILRSIGEVGTTLGGNRPLSARELLDSLGLTGVPLPSLAKARSCGAPSCDCPSPDLGEIRRLIDRPEQVQVAIRLRNTTRKQRQYRLEPGVVQSPFGEEAGRLTVAPAEVTLEPGDGIVVRAAVDATKFQPHVDYAATIKVSAENCEPMRLAVVVRVEPESEVVPVVDLHCCCTPKVRPLRWYHHYYCDPAPQRRPNDPNPNQG